MTRFQSTHSLRSATSPFPEGVESRMVSIHALLAECDQGGHRKWSPRTVSIHALLAECDGRLRTLLSPPPKFQSTHSLRSATHNMYLICVSFNVSIHALLAECDAGTSGRTPPPVCFNPRTPCGVRRELVSRITSNH